MVNGNSYAAVASLVLSSIVLPSLGAIGPVTDLAIVNGPIAPDGISRDAVLADGTFPGPVIAGYTVCPIASGCQESSFTARDHYRETSSRSTSRTSSRTPPC